MRSKKKICIRKHPRGIMFVVRISAFGPTAIRFVPPDAKVNANFYINKVLKPLFRKGHRLVCCLFGKGANSAVLYHDSTERTRLRPSSNGFKISATIFFLRGIGPLILPICRPWIIRWMEFSSTDFRSERHAAWRDWNGPRIRSGQKCLLISVFETLSAWESRVKLLIQSHGL